MASITFTVQAPVEVTTEVEFPLYICDLAFEGGALYKKYCEDGTYVAVVIGEDGCEVTMGSYSLAELGALVYGDDLAMAHASDEEEFDGGLAIANDLLQRYVSAPQATAASATVPTPTNPSPAVALLEAQVLVAARTVGEGLVELARVRSLEKTQEQLLQVTATHYAVNKSQKTLYGFCAPYYQAFLEAQMRRAGLIP